MFDPTVGRWLEEDPIGFEGGDADLYRFVGNDPTNATDPTGLEVVPADKASKVMIFADEDLALQVNIFRKRIAEWTKDGSKLTPTLEDWQRSVQVYEKFLKLRDLKSKYLHINVYYIYGAEDEAVQFAEKAATNGPGTINIYLGHGPGEEDKKVKATAIAKIGKAFADKDWKGDSRPLFGFISCFGGNCNAAVPADSLAPGAMKDTKVIIGIDLVGRFAAQFGAVEELIKKRIAKEQEVTLNLYFGAIGLRKAKDEDYPNDLRLRFANWK